MRDSSLTAAAAVLSAARAFSSDSSAVDYKSAGTLPPLEVPPDLTTPRATTATSIPETARSSATLSGYQAERREHARAPAARRARAGGAAARSSSMTHRARRQRSAGWSCRSRPRSSGRWSRISGRRTASCIKIELPEAGVMETDWAENRAKVPQGTVRDILGKLLDQLLLDLRARQVPHAPRAHAPTARAPRSTSATAACRSSTPRASRRARRRAQTAWQPRPPDPELEAEFLRRLMVRLGAPGRAREAARRRRAAAQQRAEIVKSNDGTERAAGVRAVRPRLAPRRPRARPRRLHRRGPRPPEGPVLRALRRSRKPR